MFIGHYSVSLAAKAMDKTIPLGLLFVAAQWVDILWAVFLLLGLERVRITPGFTASNPLDLYYMPFTHGLPAALFWAVLAALLVKLTLRRRASWRAAGLVGAVVLSHWALDLIVHKPDLPLIGNLYKVGLGLWDYRFASLALEIALLLAGLWLYLRSTAPARPAGRWGVSALCILMIAIQVGNLFGPPPPTVPVLAFSGLFAYGLFALLAWRADRLRR